MIELIHTSPHNSAMLTAQRLQYSTRVTEVGEGGLVVHDRRSVVRVPYYKENVVYEGYSVYSEYSVCSVYSVYRSSDSCEYIEYYTLCFTIYMYYIHTVLHTYCITYILYYIYTTYVYVLHIYYIYTTYILHIYYIYTTYIHYIYTIFIHCTVYTYHIESIIVCAWFVRRKGF